jgi:hypothetical protein
MKRMLDEYLNNSIKLTDLTFIGNDNTANEKNDYICEFCGVKLIEKQDDIAHLGFEYNRWICSKCGFIYDTKKEGDITNVKHAESIHTLTSSEDSSIEPFAECLGTTSDNNLFEKEDALDTFDSNEVQELRQHGMIIKDVVTITRSSVDGRIKEEHLEE